MEDWQVLIAFLGTIGVIAGIVRFGMFLQDRSKAQGRWEGEVNADRELFHTFMEEIKGTIGKIFERLPPALVVSGSPLRLTELGEEISKTLNGEAWAQYHAKHVAGDLGGKSKYEIQEVCRNYTHQDYDPTDDSMDERLDECAYDFGVPKEAILDVLAIELRDLIIDKMDSGRRKDQ